jgi:hypothetical protein
MHKEQLYPRCSGFEMEIYFVLYEEGTELLSESANLRKATIEFIMSLCQSVRPCATIPLLIYEFSENYI